MTQEMDEIISRLIYAVFSGAGPPEMPQPAE
jgi:hypothetical protein